MPNFAQLVLCEEALVANGFEFRFSTELHCVQWIKEIFLARKNDATTTDILLFLFMPIRAYTCTKIDHDKDETGTIRRLGVLASNGASMSTKAPDLQCQIALMRLIANQIYPLIGP